MQSGEDVTGQVYFALLTLLLYHAAAWVAQVQSSTSAGTTLCQSTV